MPSKSALPERKMKIDNITAVIPAAGEGKRLAPLKINYSKVMIPVLGKPFLEYVLDRLLESGIKESIIIISGGDRGKSIKNHFGGSFHGLKIKYVYQEEQLGPAHALSLALPQIKSEFFLVQSGDSITQKNIIPGLIDSIKNNGNDGVLTIRKTNDPQRSGIVRYKNGSIVEIVEKPSMESAPSDQAVIGTYILNTQKFKKAIAGKKFIYGEEVFPPQYMLQNGDTFASLLFEGERVDLGKPEDLFNAAMVLAKGPVNAIAFDADNTLYNTRQIADSADKKAIEILSHLTKKSATSLYQEWKKIVKSVINSKDPMKRGRLYSYEKLCLKYGQNKDIAQKMFNEFKNTLLANLKPMGNIKEILSKLPQEKIIATEDYKFLASNKLKHLAMLHFFDRIIASDVIGIMKPSKKYYSYLLSKYKAEEILAVGDNYENDLEIPSQLGMRALFVDSPQSLDALKTLSNNTPVKKLHFMGIAGAGATAVAGIAKAYGYKVSGCDLVTESAYTKNLGIEIQKGHSESHINNIDTLIVSPAIEKFDAKNPEVLKARKQSIPVLTWQEFQGKDLQKDKFVITVAGAYGKSTTTAMIAKALTDLGLDPTFEVGAKLLDFRSNYRVGKSQYYICEADEYNNNFLNYQSNIAVILNVDWDHPDFFKTKADVIKSFRKFVAGIKQGGTLIIPRDIYKSLFPRVIPAHAKGGAASGGKAGINIKILDRIENDKSALTLFIIGDFRKQNAAAALAVCKALGLDLAKVAKSIQVFKGVGRRLEYKGEIKGAKFYDDYAVQPHTIKTTINALKDKYSGQKLCLVLEPHTFSRVETFFSDFVKALKETRVDKILITDVYAAREKGDGLTLSKSLAQSVGPKAIHTGSLNETAKYLKSHLSDFNIICAMGAGDVYKLYDLMTK